MDNNTNYNETNIIGKSWKRIFQIIINNPEDNVASITLREQEVFNLNEDRKIYQDCGTLYEKFDSESELDNEIYNKLNELYILLREQRDNS